MDENIRNGQEPLYSGTYSQDANGSEQTENASKEYTQTEENQQQEYAANNAGESQTQQTTGYQSNGYQSNPQSSLYHGKPGQGMYFGGAYYSSNQHAGYNSQTGYTTAYAGGQERMQPNGQQAQTAYSGRTTNDYGYMNQNPDSRDVTDKESKESEKIVNAAKKKAAKKAKKEAKREAKRANGKKSTGRKIAGTIAAAVLFGVIAGCVFQGVRYGSDKFLNKDSSEETTVSISQTTTESSTLVDTDSTTSGTSVQYDVADVSEAVMPSIVSITGTYVTTYQYWFNTYEEEQSGAGSGIIIGQDDDNLYILTNYHVVEDATELSIGFIDGESADATVKGYDSANDVAVVTVPMSSISSDTLSQIKEITIGSSSDLRVGDPCIAIGNALGYGQSVTVGYISALDREVSVDDGTVTVLQTDAAINPGNSGGALVNMNGELIGVNTAKYVDSTVEGMGYALPISNIQEIINKILAGEDTSSGTAYLGVTVKNITSEYAEGLNMPEGNYVYSVSEGSPAEQCGLVTGDIIVAINGEDVTDSTSLQSKISSSNVGDEVEITYYRNENGEYVKKTAKATLAEKPDSSN